ncbi:MAG: ABC transporter permease [Deltaproteobacteria bacterium]|nr:ABC transporter permease [Deltaproteobacteria bacterium]
MNQRPIALPRWLAWLLPLGVAGVVLAAWWIAFAKGAFPRGTVPSPPAVWRGFIGEIENGRLGDDIVASLFRVVVGFTLAALVAVPLGLVLGQSRWARGALMPAVNFLRSLSPIAWIPFAIIWFGIGDAPAIFIIFMATAFQLTLATSAAVANIPRVYYRVAADHGIRGPHLWFAVTLPAAMPQLITALRVAAGVAWMVVVAAEMIAVRSGLGFLIVDARSGLRMDLVVVGMISIGVIGVVLDRVLFQLTRIKSVRWGYDR